MKDIKKWINNNKGILYFDELKNEEDKYMFVLVSSLFYFKKFEMNISESYKRAVEITNSHKKRLYKEYKGEKLYIKDSKQNKGGQALDWEEK